MIAIGSDHGGFGLKQEVIMDVMTKVHVTIRFMQKKLQTQSLMVSAIKEYLYVGQV